MKNAFLFAVILFTTIQLANAQQTEKVSSSSPMNLLTESVWGSSETQYGPAQIEFKKDMTYSVLLTSNNIMIKGAYSLNNNMLTFETDDAGCGETGEYTISFTPETLTFVLKQDLCEARKGTITGIEWRRTAKDNQ